MSFYALIPALVVLPIAFSHLWKQYQYRKKIASKATPTNALTNSNTNKPIKMHDEFAVQHSIISEGCILLKLGLYIGMSMIFEICVSTVGVMFMGQLTNSSQYLSASSIAHSFANGTVLVISFGFITALFTLIPEAIGANQPQLVRLYAQRAFVVSVSISIPLSLLLIYIKEILLLVGINSGGNIQWKFITNYAVRMLPTAFLMNGLSILHRVMQNTNHNLEILIIQMFVFCISIPLNYLFIVVLDCGMYGATYVYNLGQLISIIISVLFLIRKGYSFLFKPLSLNKILEKKGLYQYLKLSVPGCFQVFLMWNIREFIQLLTGYINDSELAAAITLIMIHLLYMSKFLGNGIGNAANIRIGKYIGAQNVIYAKRTMKIQTFYQILLFVISYIVYALFGYQIVSLFTNDKTVIQLIVDGFIYVTLIYCFAAAIYKNVDSVYRALGLQKISAKVICCTQYVIGFPIQCYLLFSSKYNYMDNMKLGIYAIWIPSTVAYFLADMILILLVIYYVDWNEALNKSKSRIKINNQTCKQKQRKSELLSVMTKTDS